MNLVHREPATQTPPRLLLYGSTGSRTPRHPPSLIAGRPASSAQNASPSPARALRRCLGARPARLLHGRRRRLEPSAVGNDPPRARRQISVTARVLAARRAPARLLPPCADHLLERRPSPDPDSDILGILGGTVYATSGDGLLVVVYMDTHAPASVVSKIISGAVPTRVSELNGLDLSDPDFTRFVCNPVSGELFRLPDIDGTKKTMFHGCYNTGLLVRSAAGHGPPDSYAVAMLRGDRNDGTFTTRRFLSRTGEWEKLVGLQSPLPLPRPMDIYTEAVAFAGRLWWADLTWGVISADPFSDRPELHFVELPRGSVWPVLSTDPVQVQGMHRRVGVSEGRLRYVEVSQKDPFVLSSYALDDDGSSWTLEHRVALGRLCTVNGGGPKDTPRIGVIDPLNASAICVIVGEHLLAVDMDMEKVIRCSPADESGGPAYAITSVLKPCVLPPWLASSKIPAAGTFSSNKGDAKSKTLSDILVRLDRDKKN